MSRGGRVRIVVAAAFVAACAAYAFLVVTGRVEGWGSVLFGGDEAAEGSAEQAEETEAPEPKAFAEYSWEELARVSDLIEEAGDDGADEVARRYNLENADGTLTTDVREMRLANGIACEVRLVGILHDTRTEDGSPVGLSFCVGALGESAMNGEPSVDGGWEGSDLRAEIAGYYLDLLPEDLVSELVAVDKLTNNVGITDSAESVTVTSDALWLFSAHEVCGDLDWFYEEFSDLGGFYTLEHLDDLMNLEGEQYQAFAEAGVAAESGGNGVLAQTYGGSPRTWWYRTCYPYNYGDESDLRYFYQVMESGFPNSVGYANEPAGVVCGFCI